MDVSFHEHAKSLTKDHLHLLTYCSVDKRIPILNNTVHKKLLQCHELIHQDSVNINILCTSSTTLSNLCKSMTIIGANEFDVIVFSMICELGGCVC